MDSRRITIGTRGSTLALKQTEITAAALRTMNPSITVEVKIIQTKGDINQNPIPLDTIGKGWFTIEIENALLNGEIDLAVHSLKDMASEMPSSLYIGAYLPREDARDVLITKHGQSLEELAQGAVVGTDSSRRQIQMLALRPDLQMKSLRGNVPTRIQKLASEPYDAIILAAAGLNRLGLEKHAVHYFNVHEMTPAPGQGILAIQAKAGDIELHTLLTAINDSKTAHIASIERSFSKMMGGGCKSPTGAYASCNKEQCHLIGMRADSAMNIVREEISAPWEDSAHLGEDLAKKLLHN